MSDPAGIDRPEPAEPKPVIMKNVPIGSQADRLVKVRREITHTEELTRVEQMELETRQKADAVLAEAKAKADETIAAATKQADNIRREAREKGDADAKRQALERLAGLISSLEKEINTLRAARADFLKENLAGIIDFACALAGRILAAEMKTRPEVVAERACVLLERMPPSVQVTLCVSPEDIEAIERYFQAGGGPLNRITPSLKSDPAISSGSMRLESDAGLINAGLMDTLEEVGRFLIEQARTQMQANSPPGGRGSAS